MALRIREDGRILCAAMHPAMPGDTYLHDGISYQLTAEFHVIVTDKQHPGHGQWWWANEVPPGIEVDRWWVHDETPALGDGSSKARAAELVDLRAKLARVQALRDEWASGSGLTPRSATQIACAAKLDAAIR